MDGKQFYELPEFEPVEVDGSPSPPPSQEGELVSDFNWADFVANEIGAKDGKILTGSPEEPIEYDLSELSPKQYAAILKDHYSKAYNNEPSYSEDEQYIINALREGKLEELYQQLGQELGVSSTVNQSSDLSEDQLIEWKIRNDFPNLTDEELQDEIEDFKNSPTYHKRIEAAKNQYDQAISQQKQQLDYQLQNQIVDIANNVEDIFDFEVDETIKSEALADILKADDETGNPPLIDFLGTPEGLTQTALLWRAMPKINEYVNSLHSEIDRLKQETETKNRSVVSTNKIEDFEFEPIPELKPI